MRTMLALCALLVLTCFHASLAETQHIHYDSPLYNYNPTSANISFSVEVIHRNNSPNSSLYTNNDFAHPLRPIGSGEYLMRYSMGNPPIQQVGTIDTGSFVTWTRCRPCTGSACTQTPQMYDPRNSNSYRPLPPRDGRCSDSQLKPCNPETRERDCQYRCEYVDGDVASGDVATEEFFLGEGSPLKFTLVFGCTHGINGSNYPADATGIIGLNGHPLSLISQLQVNKFSYCLVPAGTGRINFGSIGFTNPSAVASTPLIKKSETNHDYYVTLESIVVNGKSLAYSFKKEESSLLAVDTGSPYTFIRGTVIPALKKEVEKGKKGLVDPEGKRRICISSGLSDAPVIEFHFTNHCIVKLERAQAFKEVRGGVCCTILSAGRSSEPALGASAQENKIVAIDLEAKKVFFKPTTPSCD